MQHTEETQTRNAYRAMCAKLGLPRAAEARASGTLAELHESRKAVRQLVNKMAAGQEDRQSTDQENDALHYASVLTGKIEGVMDGFKDSRDAQGSGLQVMRSQADFDKRYSGGGLAADMTVSDFFRGVAGQGVSDSVRNALSEGTNTAGGFTVPDVLMPRILGAMAPNSSLLQAGMGVVVLADGAKSFTTAVIDNLPTAGWRAENGGVVESEPTFRGVVAAPKSLAFLFKVSRELLADSANLELALLFAIGQAFAKELDRAGLRGSGTAPEPRGLLNTTNVQAIANGANGVSLTNYANLFSGVQSILQANGPMPTAAIMSPRSLVKLGGLLDTTNQPLRVPPLLEGVKQIVSSQVPNNLTVGTSSDCSEIYLGDFRNMLLLLREGVSVQRADQLYAATGQVGFVCHVRADFAVMYPSAFAVVTGVRA